MCAAAYQFKQTANNFDSSLNYNSYLLVNIYINYQRVLPGFVRVDSYLWIVRKAWNIRQIHFNLTFFIGLGQSVNCFSLIFHTTRWKSYKISENVFETQNYSFDYTTFDFQLPPRINDVIFHTSGWKFSKSLTLRSQSLTIVLILNQSITQSVSQSGQTVVSSSVL